MDLTISNEHDIYLQRLLKKAIEYLEKDLGFICDICKIETPGVYMTKDQEEIVIVLKTELYLSKNIRCELSDKKNQICLAYEIGFSDDEDFDTLFLWFKNILKDFLSWRQNKCH